MAYAEAEIPAMFQVSALCSVYGKAIMFNDKVFCILGGKLWGLGYIEQVSVAGNICVCVYVCACAYSLFGVSKIHFFELPNIHLFELQFICQNPSCIIKTGQNLYCRHHSLKNDKFLN